MSARIQTIEWLNARIDELESQVALMEAGHGEGEPHFRWSPSPEELREFQEYRKFIRRALASMIGVPVEELAPNFP